MLPVAILAGGLATRLRPITETIPKALIDVAGKPFIFYQLEYLQKQGVTEVVLCTGFLGQQIEDVVKDGSRFGLKVLYSHDGPKLLGTGGAIKRMQKIVGNSAFFVLYGDSYLPIDFSEVSDAFFSSLKKALMTVLKNGNQWDKSNVLFENGVLFEYNKAQPRQDMHYIDYGLSILAADALDEYDSGKKFDLSELFHSLSVNNELAGFEVHNRFYEIGSHQGLKETIEYFSDKNKEKT